MEEITRLFFDTTAPCPIEISDCQNLRQEYLQTLDALKRQGGCSSCAERNLKNNFINRIKANIKMQ
jgi:hypothetical protein